MGAAVLSTNFSTTLEHLTEYFDDAAIIELILIDLTFIIIIGIFIFLSRENDEALY